MTQQVAAADAPALEEIKPRGVREIIAAAGGPAAISEASKGDVTIDAVYKWPKIGINDRHWPLIMSLDPTATADELLAANIAARAPQSGD